MLSILLATGMGGDPRVQQALSHLLGLCGPDGWCCVAVPELGRFRGPGCKHDPCPTADLLALKALAQVAELLDSQAAQAGADVLFWHRDHRSGRKFYLKGWSFADKKHASPRLTYLTLRVLRRSAV